MSNLKESLGFRFKKTSLNGKKVKVDEDFQANFFKQKLLDFFNRNLKQFQSKDSDFELLLL